MKRAEQRLMISPARRLLIALVVAAMLTPSASIVAQDSTMARPSFAGTSSLSGKVLDAGTGAPLRGAEVRASGPDTATTHTDARGAWTITPLVPGRYTVRIRMLGYSAHEDVTNTAVGTSAPIVALTPLALSLEQVVVTASRREQRLKEVAITTEVITRADIERTGASDVASVLTERTGIELQGGHPAGAGVMLQGIGSERVLVLLDGQPLVGRISGVFDISRIPTSIVDRIEVVKGPQSTLYGSEAMGGVINIITRTPPQGTVGASATILAGTQNRRDGNGSIILGRGHVASSIDISHRTVEDAPGVAELQGSLAARTDAAAKVRWTPDSSAAVEASVLGLDERQRWLGGTLYNFSDNRQWSGRLSGAWQRGRHRVSPTLFASVFDHLSRASTEPNPIAGSAGDRQVQRLYQGELLYNQRFGPGEANALDFGAQVKRDATRTERITNGFRALTTLESFAQLELATTKSLTVVPGVRVSRNTQWGTHVTPRLAARLKATDQLTLRASVASGYRAPDFKELYLFFENQAAGYSVIGNPDLRPENSRNVTAGAEWTSERTFLRGQLFWNGFRDFIETVPITPPDQPPVFQYRNVDNGTTQGVELETGATAGGLRLEAGYSGLSARDRGTGQPLLGRPAHAGRASFGYALLFGTRASLSGVYTGRTPMARDDATGAVTSWRDGFPRLDLHLAQRAGHGIEIIAGADNLFDKQPAQWAGFTGRHIYTGLSWTHNTEETR